MLPKILEHIYDLMSWHDKCGAKRNDLVIYMSKYTLKAVATKMTSWWSAGDAGDAPSIKIYGIPVRVDNAIPDFTVEVRNEPKDEQAHTTDTA